MTKRSTPDRLRGHRHPEWCNTALCYWYEDWEVNHTGTAVVLRGVEMAVRMQLRASDELTFDEPLMTSLDVEFDSINDKGDPARAFMSLPDVRALRDALTAQLERADAAELEDPGFFMGGAA